MQVREPVIDLLRCRFRAPPTNLCPGSLTIRYVPVMPDGSPNSPMRLVDLLHCISDGMTPEGSYDYPLSSDLMPVSIRLLSHRGVLERRIGRRVCQPLQARGVATSY